jgi:hypothetical protein
LSGGEVEPHMQVYVFSRMTKPLCPLKNVPTLSAPHEVVKLAIPDHRALAVRHHVYSSPVVGKRSHCPVAVAYMEVN